MDVFKFVNPTIVSKMEQGDVINGIKSKMWVERYIEAGEFKFVADVNTGMKDILPIGTFISHMDTYDIMIVENHEINDDGNKNPEITITGRSLETFLENRVIGGFTLFHPVHGSEGYFGVDADYIWNQIVFLINERITPEYQNGTVGDPGDVFNYVRAKTLITDTGDSVIRTLKQTDVYSAVLDLLKAGNLGIKLIRPGFWSPFDSGTTGGQQNTALLVHQGSDKSKQVIFSADTGDLSSVDYLWSNKKLKNGAVIIGKWKTDALTPTHTGFARRTMILDATDIYQDVDTSGFTSTQWDAYDALLLQRGRDALAAQNEVVITKAEISPNVTNVKYRQDYDIGDLITVNGKYNTTTQMRVNEHVEIEDETGQASYPTLTAV